VLRALPLPRTLALPRVPRRLAILAAVLVAAGAGYMVLRDSSLVAVEDVSITGLSGPEAGRLRALLSDAARDMTTLHVREEQLRAVVEPYPVVKGLSVEADPPHRLRIAVSQNVPVAALVAGGRKTFVAGDGTILPGVAPRDLPEIELRTAPGGARIADRGTLDLVRALAAAPPRLRAKIEAAGRGPTFYLDAGPELRFGSADRIRAKWTAVARVLADPSSRGATYLDARWPERVAAGGLEDPAAQTLDP
jgi:cell division protein FtsQ